jgi:hypothetical protein
MCALIVFTRVAASLMDLGALCVVRPLYFCPCVHSTEVRHLDRTTFVSYTHICKVLMARHSGPTYLCPCAQHSSLHGAVMHSCAQQSCSP